MYLQEEIKIIANFENIISQSKKFKETLKQVEQVALTSTTVLIQGETGTGKELIARAIHSISNRDEKPFVKINCAAIPENLIESELFGYKKGSFTGAATNRKGKFEIAHNGTIFLDEIGELPLNLQPKLLRVLQEGEIEKIGDTSAMRIDVRIIAATNRDLAAEIKVGNFRDDLFYRLSVFPITIPPLRDRIEDIPPLVDYLIKKNNRTLGKNIQSVPKKTMEKLMAYSWPGNIRELENIIERAMIISSGTSIKLLPNLDIKEPFMQNDTIQSLEEVEKNHIINVLKLTNWRVSGDRGAAKVLSMKPTTLESKLRKLGISKP